MNNQEYYNHTPVPLMPRLTVSDQVVLLQVDGVGQDERADSNAVIHRSFVVRTKDTPRILGECNSMLMNISKVSGASLSLSVDMRNVLNRTVQINLWGHKEDVDEAERMILNVITEGYGDPPPPGFLPRIHGYVHQVVKVLLKHEAVHFLKETNIVTLEAESSTWIDVDFSKAWKKGAAVEVDIHILGASKEAIKKAVDLINAIVSQAEPASETKQRVWTETKKKAWTARLCTKVWTKSFWKGICL